MVVCTVCTEKFTWPGIFEVHYLTQNFIVKKGKKFCTHIMASVHKKSINFFKFIANVVYADSISYCILMYLYK